MTQLHLLIMGAGNLAAEVARTLAVHSAPDGSSCLRITIASRSIARARWVAELTVAHAAAVGRRVYAAGVLHDWQSIAETAALIDTASPRLVLHTASLQSPWSFVAGSRWSRFVANCGYGVTAPLHLALAAHVQKAIALSSRVPRWINACYPDLINACLALLGPPPVCGIGNVAIVAEHIRHQLGFEPFADVRVIGGHIHVQRLQASPILLADLPPVWVEGERLSPARFAALDPLPLGPSLNAFTAAEASRLIWTMLSESSIRTHAPGPIGLLGGYPVTVDGGYLEVDLPSDVDATEAAALLQADMDDDGAVVETAKRMVLFSEKARHTLATEGLSLANGFYIDDFTDAVNAMLSVRSAWQVRE